MSRAEQIAALVAEARAAARGECLAFADALDALARQAAELSTMGDAVPVGVRELAARIGTGAQAQAATVRVITGRAAQ